MGDDVIRDTSIVARRADVLASDINGEIVVMSIEQGQCFGFDDIGSRIWTVLERPTSVSALCAALGKEYDVDPARCRRDVARLLDELAHARLIDIADAEDR